MPSMLISHSHKDNEAPARLRVDLVIDLVIGAVAERFMQWCGDQKVEHNISSLPHVL